MTVSAPAKINLSLRIDRRRPDGFHELESLMVPLELSDTLEIEMEPAERTSVDLTCSDPSIPVDEENLVVRALHLFTHHTGQHARFRVVLQKKIPAGAGLGGGSSNAAAALRAVNQMCGTPCSVGNLNRLAAQIGSDVPFFLQDGAALASGRGEVITPCPLPFKAPVLLVKPPFGIPTPWAYKTFAVLREKTPDLHGPQSTFRGVILQNDLEPAVFSKYTALQVLREHLGTFAGVETVLMSGSGSTVFALLDSGMADMQQQQNLVAAVRAYYGEPYWVAITGIAGSSR